LSKRLKYLRGKKAMSQEQMGKLLGISRQAYGKYESGKSEPDHKTMIKLATFYDVTIDYLLGFSDNPQLTAKEDNKLGDVGEKIAKRIEGLSEKEKDRVINKILAYVEIETTDASED
jgi:transcriptional regulator with XRE-family HTH domain